MKAFLGSPLMQWIAGIRRIPHLVSGPLARSSLATGAILGLRVATQAATLLLMVRAFPPAVYGQLVSAATLAVVLGILPLLGSSFVMLSRVARNPAETADIWRYAWPMTLVLGTLLLALYLPLAASLGEGGLPYSTLIWLGVAELLFSPFTVLLSFALQGRERVPLSQVVQWIPLGLRVAAAVVCLALPEDKRVQAFATLQCATAAAGAIIGYTIARKHAALDWRPRLPTRTELTDGASYASMHMVASNASEFDKIIAVRALSAHGAGIYNATSRMMVALVMPVLAMLLAAQPRLFRHADTPGAEGRKLINLLAALSACWGLASGLLLAAISPILPLLLGSDYGEAARLMLWTAAVAPFLSLRFAAGSVLVAFGRPLQRLAFEISGVLVLAVGMFSLTGHWGLRGAAMASALAEASMASIGWWMVARHLRRATW